MLRKVISGGQTGVDQAAWRAAKACGLATGGWMPRGFLTEGGPRPEFATLYGAREHVSANYPGRTRANVADADATLVVIVGRVGRGTELTIDEARRSGKPYAVMHSLVDGPEQFARFARWVGSFEVLNVAGPRESDPPTVGEAAEAFLLKVFGMAQAGNAQDESSA
jgi:hypothetical protein